MDPALKKRWLRLTYAWAWRYFAAALILCAVIGGLARSRMYFVFALCAMGGIFLLWGWTSHLAGVGYRFPGSLKWTGKRRVPFIYRKEKHRHRPAFAVQSDAFDDDLNEATSLDVELFSKSERVRARMFARLACAALLFFASVIVRY